MRLHNVAFAMNKVALWLRATGRNGREIGTHLWEIEEGAPPNEPSIRQPWQGVSYWTPDRFRWTPFNDWRFFMQHGYIRPLCGARSNSVSPRVSQHVRDDIIHCAACVQAAQVRGIVPLTYTNAAQNSPTYRALLEEQRAWVAAGRPSPWPPEPSSPTS